MKNRIVFGDNLRFLKTIPDESISLIYIDPPFNTGKTQKRTRIRTVRSDTGNRVGFQGRRYSTETLGSTGYDDSFSDYLMFIEPRIREAHRVLRPDGSLFFHIDFREVHYCKVLIDRIFGRDSFMNEIIWSYDYGGRSKRRWSAKHDNILWYAKDHRNYVFNYDDIDRIPYMAPKLVGEEKAVRGKTPTDVWWHTIVPTNGKERTGYATQKPLGILSRIVKVHSRPDDLVMDFFAGSGSFGEAAGRHGRRFILVDASREAIDVMVKRLALYSPSIINAADSALLIKEAAGPGSSIGPSEVEVDGPGDYNAEMNGEKEINVTVSNDEDTGLSRQVPLSGFRK